MKARSGTERNLKRRLRRRYRKLITTNKGLKRLYENPEIKKESKLIESVAASFFAEGFDFVNQTYRVLMSNCGSCADCLDCMVRSFDRGSRPNFERKRSRDGPVYKQYNTFIEEPDNWPF